MNLICTPLRLMLTVKHLSSLMFMSLVGPPIEQWHPLPYVKRWLSAGRHAATDAGSAQKKTHANESDAQLAVEKCFNMPTKLMNINVDKCLTVSIECSGVQIKFMWLNPRSHSAVLTGSTAVVSSWSQAA